MSEVLKSGLITQKYTRIEHEDEADFNFNAPHHFKVINVETDEPVTAIDMQKGPINECGVNGCANEDLIAIVLKRLSCFQGSDYKCRENAVAITKLEEALMWLRKRTLDREARGVEGTGTV